MRKSIILMIVFLSAILPSASSAAVDTQLYWTYNSSTHEVVPTDATCDYLISLPTWYAAQSGLINNGTMGSYTPLDPANVTVAPPANWFSSYSYASQLGTGWDGSATRADCIGALSIDLDFVFYPNVPSSGTGYLLLAGRSSPTTDNVIDTPIGYFSVDWATGTTPEEPSSDTTTRIDVVSPSQYATQATGTPVTLEADGFVSTQDNVEGLDIRFEIGSISSQCVDAICAWNAAQKGSYRTVYAGASHIGYDFPAIGSNGYFTISTSTTSFSQVGVYTMKTSLVKPTSFFGISSLFGLSFGYSTIISTTTQLTVGTTTTLDNVFLGIRNMQFGATTTAAALASCNPLSFNLSDCMEVIFMPDVSSLSDIVSSARDGFLSVVPWGYVTRFVTIASGSATSSLPSLVIDFSHAPLAEASLASGASLDLTPWSDLMSTSSIMGTATSTYSGKTFRQIVEPGWDVFVLVSFAVLIVHELLRTGHAESKKTNV